MLLTLILGFQNFRYVDRPPARVALQVGVAAICVLAYTVAQNVWMALRF